MPSEQEIRRAMYAFRDLMSGSGQGVGHDLMATLLYQSLQSHNVRASYVSNHDVSVLTIPLSDRCREEDLRMTIRECLEDLQEVGWRLNGGRDVSTMVATYQTRSRSALHVTFSPVPSDAASGTDG